MEGLVLQTLGELRASADWTAIDAEYHADAPPATALGAQDGAFWGDATHSPAPPETYAGARRGRDAQDTGHRTGRRSMRAHRGGGAAPRCLLPQS